MLFHGVVYCLIVLFCKPSVSVCVQLQICGNIHIYSEVPFTLVAELLAKGQCPEGPATSHLGTDFLGFPVSIREC